MPDKAGAAPDAAAVQQILRTYQEELLKVNRVRDQMQRKIDAARKLLVEIVPSSSPNQPVDLRTHRRAAPAFVPPPKAASASSAAQEARPTGHGRRAVTNAMVIIDLLTHHGPLTVDALRSLLAEQGHSIAVATRNPNKALLNELSDLKVKGIIARDDATKTVRLDSRPAQG